MQLSAAETTTLWTAFVFGLLASVHCLGMCGPLLALAESLRGGKWKPWSQLPLHIGRLITYSIMGLIAGIAGGALEEGGIAAGIQGTASMLGGAAMIFFAAVLLSWVPWWRPLEASASFVNRFAGGLSSRRPLSGIFLGLYWGLLPCGLVWAALMGAAGGGGNIGTPAVTAVFGPGPWQSFLGPATGGALLMLAFGAGTVPALLVAGGLGGMLGARARLRMHRLAAIVAMLLGTLLLLRGASSAGWIG